MRPGSGHTANIIALIMIGLIPLNVLTAAKVANHDVYFQQYVNYTIDVKLNITDNMLHATERMVYQNNSPDTLAEIYFHLYINKYRRHSLMYPDVAEDRGWIEITSVTTYDSVDLDYSIDQTLMHLNLGQPLAPGDSVVLNFLFDVKIPPASERYGYQGLHYDIGNWFVTPVVYDRFGWHLHQHLDQEFYQEWGDFRVTIHVPQDFRVGATGNLLNAEDVLPRLDSESPELYRADYSDTILVNWEFEAKMVHDFAWTTDPSYKLLQSEWNGITLNVLVMDYNLESWQGVTEWGLKALQYFCETYGMYPYKQLTVADTYIQAGGIEYPQIVMINDFINPDFDRGEFRAVIIHEMAHNWYYGLLANNQTEHEWLDEGLTSYAEVKAMEAIFGVENNMAPGDRGWLANTFSAKNDSRTEQVAWYLKMSKTGLIYDPIDLPPDYLGDRGYILQYNKMACVMHMLESVLGDSVMNRGLNNYFLNWHFRHPYPDDFIYSLATAAQCDLDWYFDQWLRTDRKLDYAFDNYQYISEANTGDDSVTARVSFRRKEEIFMPLDFNVRLKNGLEKKFRIPTDAYCQYETEAVILPYWHFSKDTHTVIIKLEDKIEQIAIDPAIMLLDEYQLDNVSGFLPPMEWHFMEAQGSSLPADRYVLEAWPLIFYNDIDKAKIGVNIDGSYLTIDHQINFNFWYKTATQRLDFDLDYQTPVSWLGLLTDIEFRLFTLDGRQGGHFGLARNVSNWREPQTSVRMGIANHQLFDTDYLTGPWAKGNVNTLYLAWVHRTTFGGWNPKEEISLNFQTSTFGSAYQFSRFWLIASRKFWDGMSDLEFNVRLFAGFGEHEVPPQFLYNLAGDNSWGEFGDIFYRSRGSLPWPWKRSGNLYKSGGPDVKGYALYNPGMSQYGRNALAINLDLRIGNPLDRMLPYYLSNIYPHAFLDFGQVWDNKIPDLKTFRASGGVSLVWESIDLLDYIFNLQKIRLDFPVWMNYPGNQGKSVDFRWLIRFEFN